MLNLVCSASYKCYIHTSHHVTGINVTFSIQFSNKRKLLRTTLNFTNTRKPKYVIFTVVLTHCLHVHYPVTLLLWQPLKKKEMRV